ncbi:hypothetical protein ILP92_03605 [Maribius pontilimi]|uniref:Uncharacterized protein n=1 Tax=Palleronia pontilimi TaxID=1964209 RepID=A0A934IH90_9RHOB|nr:hypothetical protein [Palleronia pontilimi]MBJ3761834.1 hypothetical protein [Palleronia pontilimi]
MDVAVLSWFLTDRAVAALSDLDDFGRVTIAPPRIVQIDSATIPPIHPDWILFCPIWIFLVQIDQFGCAKMSGIIRLKE